VPGSAEPLPAYSLRSDSLAGAALASDWPFEVTRDWALGGSKGDGVKVCVLDSGIDGDHPAVGGIQRSVAVIPDEQRRPQVLDDDAGDLFGHGTACAGIIRSLAPACELASARVLGGENRGPGEVMIAGLHWAVEQGYRLINMSLSTSKQELVALLHAVADNAYFRRAVIVASAHNRAVESYPWRFGSVISVGSHERPEPLTWFYNPDPPVEFFCAGAELEVAWLDGGTIRSSGNSFATAHMTGICAQILAKHPELTPFELKSVLYLTADNVARAGA
jgi:subtilisin family serine protease